LLGPGKYQIVQYLSVLSVANMPFTDFLHPSEPEAAAQAGRLGFERRPERENLGCGDPGYFLLGCEVWSPPRAHRRRPGLFSFASIFHLLSSIFSSRQAYKGGAFKK
jgi:hypothetical protein